MDHYLEGEKSRPLTAVGVVLFGESLNRYEVAGIGLAVASLILLVRFA